MSKLTKIVEQYWNRVGSFQDGDSLLGRIRAALPAHDAETRTKAQREQMEADCCAVCYLCSEGDAAWLDNDQWRTWRHGHEYFMYCCAHSIRAAWAKAHPEEAQGE